MTAATGDDVLEYRSIDDILGAGGGRFFSSGFKRVEQRLEDITAETDGLDRIRLAATAWLSYPADWSKKSPDINLRPHLSSVDAMLFGIVMSELLLTHRHALDPGQRRRMWLRGISIRAGSTPTDELAGFPVSASAQQPRPAPGPPNRYAPNQCTTLVECRIGTLKVRCEIDHEAPAERTCAGHYATAAELLGPDTTRYYGAGFKDRRHLIERLGFTPDRTEVTADVSVLPSPREELAREGLGGQYQPSLSAIDCMVTMAQVNQALLYLQDAVDRSESNTLWLRKFTLVADRPDQPFDAPFPVTARAVHSELVKHAGHRWRTFMMAGGFRGFSGHSLLAHRLPTTDTRGE